MKKLKDLKKNKLTNKQNRRDGANWFLMFFGVLFVAMAARVLLFGGEGTPMMPGMQNTVQAKPVELSFSDVLRRAPEIETMKINGNSASGVLSDGTKYTATITYDPEMLAKLS